ncbi:MAG: LemA family protein, partial [Kiritimatiellae bacterium]|nr:LemA family protein [Kiritimatiellia bacterium]
MHGILIALLVVVVLLVALVAWVVGLYNGLVVLKNRFKNAFAQIDVQLRRRYDLIPNLVETAKGYLKHERETLTAVIEARNQAAGAAKALAAAPGDPAAVKAFSAAESGLAGVLSRLMVVVERYPDLTANEQLARVSEELTSTENRIAFSRQAYNDSVTEYNTKRELF